MYMSETAGPNAPFKTLGTHLRYLREQSNETIAEVSGAVEIDDLDLEKIEAGVERPAEDILLLLINHFDMQDQEATQLWELAGYGHGLPDYAYVAEDTPPNNGKNLVMLLALDMRTIYTDALEVRCGPTGLTMQFGQVANQSQVMPVARLGMSYEQAEQALQTLQQALLRAKYLRGPKALPPQTDTNPSSTQSS